jgi:hypothetical protein
MPSESILVKSGDQFVRLVTAYLSQETLSHNYKIKKCITDEKRTITSICLCHKIGLMYERMFEACKCLNLFVHFS